MRIYQTGFELDDELTFDGALLLYAERWTTGAASTNIEVENAGTEPWVHTNPFGLGGTNAIYRNYSVITNNFFSPRFIHNFKDAWIGFAFKLPTNSPSRIGIGNALEGYDNLIPQMEFVIRPDGGSELWLGDSTDSGTNVSSSLFNLTPGYHWFAIRYHINNSSGTFQVYADNTLYINYTGSDTQGSATYNYWDTFMLHFEDGAALDDFVLNAITISYTGGSGGSGTPTIGNTVTGGTSGSTATITDYKETSSGVGYIVLEQPSAGFNDAESISDGSGWTATTAIVGGASPGFDKNSSQPDETYIVLTRPNSTVSAGLSGSDGDSIDNHNQVNDTFVDESTYNFTTTSGTEDVYGMESLPFSPGAVDAVEPVIYGNRAGSISGARTIVDPGLGNTYSETLQIGSGGTSARASKIYDVNPDTDTDWTESDVNSTDAGVRLV